MSQSNGHWDGPTYIPHSEVTAAAERDKARAAAERDKARAAAGLDTYRAPKPSPAIVVPLLMALDLAVALLNRMPAGLLYTDTKRLIRQHIEDAKTAIKENSP